MAITILGQSPLWATSFFSDLCCLDKESPQYPKACNVGKVIGHVVALNYFKHKPDKNFSLTTMKGTYPVHLLEEQNDTFDNETECCHSTFYWNSKFDYLDLHNSKHRTQKYDITYTVSPQRCVPGVHKHYKQDESQFLPETHARLNPRPFTQDEYQHDPVWSFLWHCVELYYTNKFQKFKFYFPVVHQTYLNYTNKNYKCDSEC